jgi:hypothetical protein
MKRDVTLTGIRTQRGKLNDGVSFVQRYIANNWRDRRSQRGVNLLLQGHRSRRRDCILNANTTVVTDEATPIAIAVAQQERRKNEAEEEQWVAADRNALLDKWRAFQVSMAEPLNTMIATRVESPLLIRHAHIDTTKLTSTTVVAANTNGTQGVVNDNNNDKVNGNEDYYSDTDNNKNTDSRTDKVEDKDRLGRKFRSLLNVDEDLTTLNRLIDKEFNELMKLWCTGKFMKTNYNSCSNFRS